MAVQPEEHAKYSPSSSEGWLHCRAYVAMNEHQPDQGSNYAEEGTAAHMLAALCLATEQTPFEYPATTLNGIEVTDEMREEVAKYYALVKSYAEGKELQIEQRLSWSEACRLPAEVGEQFGTSDAVIIDEAEEELTIIDLKFGRGVEVHADANPQLLLYAIAARWANSLFFTPKTIRLVICQPRRGHHSEWACDAAYLDEFEKTVRTAVVRNEAARQYVLDGDPIPDEFFHPSESSCRWCKAKGHCAALEKHVFHTVAAEFDNLEEPEDQLRNAISAVNVIGPERLGELMSNIGLIEDWLKAIRGRTEATLLAGQPVPGWKLVQGKQGNRAWTDAKEVEGILKGMRYKKEEMYDFKLISPTTAEKLMKSNPGRWDKLQKLITRSPGQPSVAPASDKRPALSLGAKTDDFENLDEDI